MKILKIILFCFLITACQTDKKEVSGKTSLKDLPETFFSIGHITNISLEKEIIRYNNKYSRLANTEFSKFHLKDHPETYQSYFNITLNLSVADNITLDGTPNDTEHLIHDIKDFSDFASQGKPTLLHLNFDENNTFESFYDFLQLIEPIESDAIKINKKLFIYDIKQLPDCDCSL